MSHRKNYSEVKTPLSRQNISYQGIGTIELVQDMQEKREYSGQEFYSLLQELSNNQSILEQGLPALKIDSNGIIQYVSDKFCEISQYSKVELLGQFVGFLSSSYQFDSPETVEVFSNLANTLATGQIWQGELQLQAKDGTDYWLKILLIPIITADKSQQYFALGFEITKPQATNFSETVEAVVEKNRFFQNGIKDEFLAVLSHELRSPLSTILGWAQLALSRKDSATTLRALNIIERNAKLQTQLIEDLLDLSRLMRGKTQLNLQPLNLTSSIKTALDRTSAAALAKNLQLKCQLDPANEVVCGDPERLQQAIANLLSNAIKFTPEGGTIEVQLTYNPTHALLQIRDTGCGIRSELLPHIFDFFDQGDGTKKRQQMGLGLGLALTRQLVELHKGNIWASSPGLNQGTTFTLQFPLAQPETAPPHPEQQPPCTHRPEAPAQPLAGKQILVVDGNADTRDFLVSALVACGAQVRSAANVPDALAELEKGRPDVLVNDLAMPGENKYDLIHQIRAREVSGQHLPAVALTTCTREEDRVCALEAGFEKHLAKPIEPSHLVSEIAHLAGLTGQGPGEWGMGNVKTLSPRLSLTPYALESKTVATKQSVILVVEDNDDLRHYLQSLLSQYYCVIEAGDGMEGLEKARTLKPDLILSDQVMPRCSGLELLQEIRQIPELRLTPVIFLTARRGTQARIESFDAGADDYISKPFDEAELLARVRNLLRSHAAERELTEQKRLLEAQKQHLESVNRTLHHLATVDSLTAIANRHHFNEYLNHEWRCLARNHSPLSLILCDIDYFKLYNDTYGHQAGDECLRQVATALQRAVKRPADLVARYGGEEFAVILPHTDLKGAACVAEAIRTEVQRLQIEHAKSQVNPFITLSLGVACWVPTPNTSPSILIAEADEALYRAKETGRNRVVPDLCQ